MRVAEERAIADALGGETVQTRNPAGVFSRETALVSLTGRRVVARLGGASLVIETATIGAARRLTADATWHRIITDPADAAILDGASTLPTARDQTIARDLARQDLQIPGVPHDIRSRGHRSHP